MIIAMPAVRMVQVPVHHIVNVVPMRHRLVPAVHAVMVIRPVRSALVPRGAVVRIRRRHRQRVLLVVVPMMMVQMPVMQVVHMVPVNHPLMPAPRPMNVHVRTIGVYLV